MEIHENHWHDEYFTPGRSRSQPDLLLVTSKFLQIKRVSCLNDLVDTYP
jgi:hypothetical protein